MSFIFDTETYCIKIYVMVAHDLDMTFVTYLQKVISKNLQMFIFQKHNKYGFHVSQRD